MTAKSAEKLAKQILDELEDTWAPPYGEDEIFYIGKMIQEYVNAEHRENKRAKIRG